MVAVKPREVPAKQAEKFLEGIEDDPKFVRHQRRQNLSLAIAEFREASRSIRAKRGVFVIVGGALVVAAAVLRMWWLFSAMSLATTTVWALMTRRVLQLENAALDYSEEIAEIDREAGSAIRIIDPNTFGAPPAPPKQEAQEA